jgi:formylglycine-generating enzyme required for sulfatase activity
MKPATIDFPDGFPDGKTMLAIYRWEGRMLRICGSPHERPTDFTTAPGSERILIVLRNDAGKIEIKHPPPEPRPLALGSFDEKEAKQRQDAWAKHLGIDVETTNSIGMKLRLIPPAQYRMGSTKEQIAKLKKEATEAKEDSWQDTIEGEGPVHNVRLRQPYYMGVYEVTMAQFRRFVEAKSYKTEAERNGKGGMIPTGTGETKRDPKATWRNPYNFAVKDDFPVLQISWNDAQEFCRWLSEKESRTYRLPTEAEWEFACRAGSTGLYSFGDHPLEQDHHAVFDQAAPRSVGSKKPNQFGLFDMEGNAWEWCADWLGSYSDAAKPNPVGFTTNPRGPLKGTARAVRGGDYLHLSWVSRPAVRVLLSPSDSNAGTGFRVVIVGDLKATAPQTEKKSARRVIEFDPAKETPITATGLTKTADGWKVAKCYTTPVTSARITW